jgi:Holliday junction resolvase RusA-like endonuclease
MDIWRVIDVNPEPWVAPPFTVARNRSSGKAFAKAGKNSQLAAFQDAVREALESSKEIVTGEIVLRFFFWRRLDQYKGVRRTVTKNQVDATNLQKATEDALQGIFFGNDRNVRDVRSVIVEQGQDVIPRIVLNIQPWVDFDPNEIPMRVWEHIDHVSNIWQIGAGNVWPPQ